MTTLAGRVLAAIRRDGLVASGDRVIAAVSGGADSVALAHLLAELAHAGALQLAGIAHLNHQLRGAASDRDEAFARQVAADCRVPFDVERCDVAAIAAAERRSLEDAARRARYDFLERARVRLGADLVAVAHTLDDQAETVLLRLMSGAGPKGLSAILRRRGSVVRPLLEIRRDTLRGYLRQKGLTFVEDESNDDRSRRRNRLRHDVMPRIVEAGGEGAIEAMARAASIAQADEALLEALTARAAGCVLRGESPLQLDAALVRREPLGLRRRLMRFAVERATGRTPSFRQIDAMVAFVDAGRPGRIPVPGGRLELSSGGGVLVIEGSEQPPAPAWARWEYTLAVPGEVVVAEAAGVMRASLDGPGGGSTSALTIRLKRELVGDFLTVRPWKPGDRVRLPWGSGRKKVQDVFVDRKVPRTERHATPVVVAQNGQILWVAGHAVAGGAAAGPATKSVVVLSFERFGRRST